MKVILDRLWTEPAACVSALVLALSVAQQALPVSGMAHVIVTGALIALGGGVTRSSVTPSRVTARRKTTRR